MRFRNLFKGCHSNSTNQQSHPPKNRRTINVQTDYGSLEIVNLKRVWINEYLGTYRLMYSDDVYEYNSIYWTDTPRHNLHHLKKRLIEAYNNGDAFVEL